jgi:hypothetical protein
MKKLSFKQACLFLQFFSALLPVIIYSRLHLVITNFIVKILVVKTDDKLGQFHIAGLEILENNAYYDFTWCYTYAKFVNSNLSVRERKLSLRTLAKL